MAQTSIVVAIMAFAYLSLVTLADAATHSTWVILLMADQGQGPDWGKTVVVVSAVSDVIGQLVMLRVIGARGSRFALQVNVSNMLVISIISFISVNLPAPSSYILAAVIVPLLRCAGGGSYTSSYLAFTMLHHNPNANLRSVYYYLTGAINLLIRLSGIFILVSSMDGFKMTASIVSIVCCVLAYGIITFYRSPESEPEGRSDDVEPSVTEPLLPPPEQTEQNIQQSPGQIAAIIRGFHEDTGNVFVPGNNKNIPYVAAVLFLMASCKPALGLSTLYFIRRLGEYVQVWTILHVVIYALILPAIVLLLAPRISVLSNSTLYIGQVSILIGVLGALETGLASNVSLATIGAVLNAFGSAARLSLLAFAANLIPDRVAGRVYLFIASLESIGSLIGIGISFPMYFNHDKGDVPVLAGPVLYFICAGIYLVAAVLVWALDPIPEEREVDGAEPQSQSG